ncbi:MAG: ornithine cyclodeaminase family protein, partial [Firmicutes bacterium]|nr:ornithine cyclodeaminase family protein [Bacillota bacterium]
LGAGQQALFQLAASITLMPNIKKIWVADPVNQPNAEQFAANCPGRLKNELGVDADHVEFKAVTDLAAAVGEADIIITVTPSRSPLIMKEWVKPGTHFSCIGSDMEGKEEIDPEIFRGARVFGDDLAQCKAVGEMEIPLKKGTIKEEELGGEIGQVLAGETEGRTAPDQITIFDATGLSALDLITAKIALEA